MNIKRLLVTFILLMTCSIPAFASYADTFTRDVTIKAALEVLAENGAKEVFDNLEENSVKISFYDLSQIRYDYGKHFAVNSVDTMGNRYILVNSKFKNATPEEIACIIAHESFHKLAVATLEEETLATQKEAYYWSILKNKSKKYESSTLLSRLDGLVKLRDASDSCNDLIKEKITRNAFYREQLAIR